ncbi:hypothetical protein [Aliamphritea spongicola]|nr:hypothetical protein [Aliamphritea spongicola]
MPIPEKHQYLVKDQGSGVSLSAGALKCPQEVVNVMQRLLSMIDPDDPDRDVSTVKWEDYGGFRYLHSETEIDDTTLITEEELPLIIDWLDKVSRY